ncbi:hypothetical protein Cs7R123_42720 [Catellatospora sp. TT07R-123]|uniref:hypothetical protein n=1 Tax=Catellatospora sp. TT07R-123 TaxID=2733863 RepID=UPI001B2D8A8D|nr:hypothetical protein [Catellatospora sp. TT07R-123]GHJ46930.1 hypothetical protein Cs7R123_42720 [Catellatospora sp. TT07R-123]
MTTEAVARWHHLLLRLSGRIPDGLLAEARGLLAHGLLDELADRVGTTVAALELTVTAAEAALLGPALPPALVDDADVMPPYGLAPVAPHLLARHGDRIPPSLDLTAAEGADELHELDHFDWAVLAAAAAPIRALWRVWRFPTADTPWAEPKRMYVAEVDPAHPTALPGTTLRLQHALTAAGETDPLVESYADSGALPAFHRYARAYAALLWSARPPVEVRLARVFDGADPVTGPYFDPAHARVTDDTECERLLAYLRAGVPLLATASRLDDVVAPGRGAVVPMTFRTDGHWIWTDAVGYYLDRHRLSPDPDLVAWIRQAGDRQPEADGAAVHRATAALYAA